MKKTAYKHLHHGKDEILLVANILSGATKPKIKIFNHNIKYKEVLYKLQQRTISYEENDDFNFPIHQYYLNCKISDIKFINLLKSICNQDMNINPKIKKLANINGKRVGVFIIGYPAIKFYRSAPRTMKEIDGFH